MTGPNYGCGSNREHAVWGMRQLGIACVVGSTFGGIFADNCARNSVPAITLPVTEVERLLSLAAGPATCEMTVDLERQEIVTPCDGRTLHFDFNPLRRHMLLKGLDAVGMTMKNAEGIRAFERKYFEQRPWLSAA